jgi:hypothetical protein
MTITPVGSLESNGKPAPGSKPVGRWRGLLGEHRGRHAPSPKPAEQSHDDDRPDHPKPSHLNPPVLLHRDLKREDGTAAHAAGSVSLRLVHLNTT